MCLGTWPGPREEAQGHREESEDAPAQSLGLNPDSRHFSLGNRARGNGECTGILPSWKGEAGSLEPQSRELQAIRHLGWEVHYEDGMTWGWEELHLGWEELELRREELEPELWGTISSLATPTPSLT